MNLKVLRVIANLTQAEVAEMLGVNQATVSDWENGQYKPSAASISRLAEAYGVSEAKILKGIELARKAVEEAARDRAKREPDEAKEADSSLCSE